MYNYLLWVVCVLCDVPMLCGYAIAGQTIVDLFNSTGDEKNTTLVKAVDGKWVWEMVFESLEAADANSPINTVDPTTPPSMPEAVANGAFSEAGEVKSGQLGLQGGIKFSAYPSGDTNIVLPNVPVPLSA